ncbi:MAG: SUMF1/EgtB/PvdO family nonheme iron enzyme [Spirochaetales bacterium]|nr:SUMF1/EgtB/PvdO family nonheme iron enzyme [Spirochaetales bacterium]
MQYFTKSKFYTVIILVSALPFLHVSCGNVQPVPEIKEQIRLKENNFTMIYLPAIEFPGGPAGVTALQEHRKEMMSVDQAFWFAQTNTTYSLWSEVYGWASVNGYTFNRQGRMGSEKSGEGMNDQHPVTVVDWPSVMVWCNALTEYYNQCNGTDFRPVYEYNGVVVRDAADRTAVDSVIMVKDADGFRLPMGAEWELAARYSTTNPDNKYQEHPPRSGIYWIPFIYVSGEIEGSIGEMGSEKGRIVTVEVTDTRQNSLGFYGFAGKEGKLWQWCFELLTSCESRDTYRLKRGGSRGPRCSRHDNWPKTKWTDTCAGYNQITFRVARTAAAE